MSLSAETINPAPKVREISYDGIMSDADEKLATGLSRVTRWRLEREGKYPIRVQLSPGRVGRLGREVQDWINARPRVNQGPLKESVAM